MTTAAYGSDLTDITNCDSGSFFEFTGYAAGTLQTVPEQDYFIQDGSGSGGCVSSTVKTTLCSIGFNNGSGVTVPTDGAVFFWQVMFAPNSLNSFVNGGQRCFIGSGTGDFDGWISGGVDYPPNPYGGWKNVAIDPTVTPDFTTGTPSGTLQYFGLGISLPTTYPGKGAPFGMDAIRYGRGEARINGGTTPDSPATFGGLAAANDALATRWGLFQAISGGFLWKGLITLGYTSAVDFRDQNRVIVIDDCPRVGANFNKIEIRQSGSRVDLTNCSLQSLADATKGTVSKGRLEVVDDCDVNIDGCTFTDMDTFIFKASSSVINTTFRRCGIITANGATFANSAFAGYEGTADSSYLVWDVNSDPNNPLNSCAFTKGTEATHAITFGTNVPTTMTLTGIAFSGYNASDSQNDSTLYFADTAGTSITVNLQACTGNISYKSAGATISLVTGQVTVTIENLVDNTEVRVYSQGTTTELAGTENATDGSSGDRSFSFTLASSTIVDVRVFAVGYLPADILGFTIPAANASIPASQIFDRVYQNV